MGCGAPCGSKTPITQKRLDLVLKDVEEQLQEVQARLLGSEQASAASRAANEATAETTSVRLSQVTSGLEERWAEDARELHEKCETNEHFSRSELRRGNDRCASLEKSQCELSFEFEEAEAAMHDTERRFAAHRVEESSRLCVVEGRSQELSEQLNSACRAAVLENFEQESRISCLHRERDASIAQCHEVREHLWAEQVRRESSDQELLLLRRRLEELNESKVAAATQHLKSEGHANAFEQMLRSQCNELRQERNEVMEQRDAAFCERDAAMRQFRATAFEHGKELALEQGQAAGLQSSLTDTRLQLRRERDQILRLHEAAAVSAKSGAARAAATYLNCVVDQSPYRHGHEALRYGRSVDTGCHLQVRDTDPRGEYGQAANLVEPINEPKLHLLPSIEHGAMRLQSPSELAAEAGKTAGFLCSLHDTKLQLQQERNAIERLHSAMAIR